MKPNRIPVSNKLKKLLQQEIKSHCPFCSSCDIACFEYHHIDGDRSKTTFDNLIMICPTCHTKIEQGTIYLADVMKKKASLRHTTPYIEFVSAVADSRLCNWMPSEENANAFFNEGGDKSEDPILKFSFINHSAKTIILKSIKARFKKLPRGISGLGPRPKVLKSLATYSLKLVSDKEKLFTLLNPLSIPAKEGFMFRIQFCVDDSPGKVLPITGRAVIYLNFLFSDNLIVEIPYICLNCNEENEPMKIYTLG